MELSKYAMENILPEKSSVIDFLAINNPFIDGLNKLSYKTIEIDSSLLGRLDIISYRNYNTVDLWWIIAIFNNIVDIRGFKNTVIKLPDISELDNLIAKTKEV